MSLGLKTLKAIIDGNAKSEFKRLNDRLFVEEEKPVYEFCAMHLRRYGKLPTFGTCKSHGHILPSAKEPAQYYIGRLHDRAVFLCSNQAQERLAKAMLAQDSQAIINCYRQGLSEMTGISRPDHYTSLGTAASDVVKDYDLAYMTQGLRGVTSGWETLDELTQGFMPGELIILVSRPYMGKTYELIYSATQAWRAAHSAVVVSMEMLTTPIVRRWIGVDQNINPKYLKMGRLSRWTENRLRQTVEDYETGAPVHFISGNFEKSVAGIDQVISLLKPDIVYVDAGYLLSPSANRKYGATHEMLSQVVKDLKMLCTAHGIPVFVTVQFNRQATVTGAKGKGTRLDLKDIGGTDAVGQDADIILGLRKPGQPFSETRRIMETMKIREGEVKDFATYFTFSPMRFSECPLEGLERAGVGGGDGDEQQGATDLSFMM